MDRKILVVAGLVLLVLVVFSAFTGGMFLGKVLEQQRAEKYAQELPSAQKVQEVLQIIDHAYVEPVSDRKLINGAVEGMLKALDDPYTHYLDAKHTSAFEEEMSGHFDGVGLMLSEDKSRNGLVVAPMEGAPAEKAGVKLNDVIVKIGKQSTKDMGSDKAVKLIRGKRGTQVTLTMRREGAKDLLVFKLTREQITIPNVVEKKLNGNIGYIRLYQFNESTTADIKKHYNSLKSQGVKGLILDLRHNPGGILTEAVSTASLWIPSGPVVKIQNRNGDIDSKNAEGGADAKMPIVVLINKGSASASEILSGALQDYGRAVIVGETSFGKACVQTVIKLEDGSTILLTTDKYLTPKGRMIQKKGIKPDVVVKFDHKNPKDNQLQKAIEVMNDVISGKRKLKLAS
ncbi:MAG: hypothetical protein COW32_08600 [Candidatus Aquicultor secundus]|uniref:PDZ domain-containing protein n=1 Tax=Candidatus Aquicultor secundus TaxID=1973895 RepID=A0A2M7T550_9ACTN|nr:S41 family peptidase [Candidatus Aquicultor secundus]NCO65723.1 S41 family peptidase [Solirubrobacter sp.]OIO88688.1 MAG: hypothetical protein AUK32_00860 [Candidatus Aquicultor secundus]PIU26630.1 MAG: hypothetical protein COT10_07660 [Candidatus Aquicultor secundus]PIW21718.1 MAG: hypothetical protein COW32_08600 [Candidatus Aquicultor secundus]PIX53186.1 MAG: hypothetical protein COZ51_00175 [Candidatus Aquicultor secundus]